MSRCTGVNCPMQNGTVEAKNCIAETCQWRTSPMTNADRIRAMTDEELATLFTRIMAGNNFDHVTDYISREAAIDAIWKPEVRPNDLIFDALRRACEEEVKHIPAADVRPVVKAEWVECDWCVPSHGFVEHYKNAAWKCTNCKHAFKKQDLFVRNFCPNCGADMREVDADGKS